MFLALRDSVFKHNIVLIQNLLVKPLVVLLILRSLEQSNNPGRRNSGVWFDVHVVCC